MYQTRKTFVKPEMKAADLIFENSSLLLMMEYFGLDIVVRDKSVEQICDESNINPRLFLLIANLYNGFNPSGTEGLDKSDVNILIKFLKNSHRYYLDEKIPDIHNYIKMLYAENNSREIKLVESFFNEYSQEVKEHLGYEDVVAFPYFLSLTSDSDGQNGCGKKFSAAEFLDHHTDIETKLTDLKQLLLKHISLKSNPTLRRKLLLGLFELEYNLTIHSLIEESVLIPLIKEIEKQQTIG